MIGRTSLRLHLSVLVISAVCAYFILGSKDEENVKGVTILDIEGKDLQRLVYTAGGDKKIVEVSPRQGGGFTLMVSEKIKKEFLPKPEEKKPEPNPSTAPKDAPKDGKSPKAADAKPAEAKKDGKDAKPVEALPKPAAPTPPVEEYVTQKSSYRASKEFESSLDRLVPLVAERELGTPSKDKMVQFGLDKSDRLLTIESKGQKISFVIGNETFGGATSYVMDQQKKTVYLVSSGTLRSIDFRSPRYMERRPIGLEKKDVKKVVVANPSVNRELLFQGPEQKGQWVAADKPAATNELFGNWIEKLFRLGIEEYLESTPPPTMKHMATFELKNEDRVLDTLRIEVVEVEGKKDFYSHSSFTGGWVKLRRSETEAVVSDLTAVLDRG